MMGNGWYENYSFTKVVSVWILALLTAGSKPFGQAQAIGRVRACQPRANGDHSLGRQPFNPW
jgi:hypothetical protein